MKTLYDYILEGSLLDNIDDILDTGDNKVAQALIQKFLEENYRGEWIISEKPNKDGLFEVSSDDDIIVKNKKITSFTNDMFVWTSVKGFFDCSYCKKLKSLKGAPEKVEYSFYCSNCNSLKSLKGAPEKVECSFDCSNCNSLKSLKGAPKEVVGIFYCANCNSLTSLEGAPEEQGNNFSCCDCKSLKSLEGAPKKVEGCFDCSGCKSLKSLEGAPEIVEGFFDCSNCGEAFTEDDVKKISKINGSIYC